MFCETPCITISVWPQITEIASYLFTNNCILVLTQRKRPLNTVNTVYPRIGNEVYHIWKREVHIRKYTGLCLVVFHAMSQAMGAANLPLNCFPNYFVHVRINYGLALTLGSSSEQIVFISCPGLSIFLGFFSAILKKIYKEDCSQGVQLESGSIPPININFINFLSIIETSRSKCFRSLFQPYQNVKKN